jgi:hypothetical protein
MKSDAVQQKTGRAGANLESSPLSRRSWSGRPEREKEAEIGGPAEAAAGRRLLTRASAAAFLFPSSYTPSSLLYNNRSMETRGELMAKVPQHTNPEIILFAAG